MNVNSRTVGDDGTERKMKFGLDVLSVLVGFVILIVGASVTIMVKADHTATLVEEWQRALPGLIKAAIIEHDKDADYPTRREFESHDHHGRTKRQGG